MMPISACAKCNLQSMRMKWAEKLIIPEAGVKTEDVSGSLTSQITSR
jgi:hypothetical protein